MVKLNTASPEQLDQLKAQAAAAYAPLMLREALRRLCRTKGAECLEEFEASTAEQIERTGGDTERPDVLKELAIEQLHAAVRDVRAFPHNKQMLEEPAARRTRGRSENIGTLEEQLQSGLEDSFPASDPPAVVSTTISGRAKEPVGVEEVLRRQREEQSAPKG